MYGGFLNYWDTKVFQSIPNTIRSPIGKSPISRNTHSSHVTSGFSLRFCALAPASSLVHRDAPQLEAGIQLLGLWWKGYEGVVPPKCPGGMQTKTSWQKVDALAKSWCFTKRMQVFFPTTCDLKVNHCRSGLGIGPPRLTVWCAIVCNCLGTRTSENGTCSCVSCIV